MEGLAPIDGLAVLAIGAKAVEYGAVLLAMGGALFIAVFRARNQDDVLRLVRRITIAAAVVGLAVLALRFGIRAARISGMGFDGATDRVMLGFVWASPLGTAAIWRGLGAVAILALVLPGLVGRVLPLMGAIAVAVSYAQIGHTLGEPRLLLMPLLTLHLLAAAFWVGALAPLWSAADDASLLHRFGVIASGIVPLLAVTGFALAWLLSGSLGALVTTAHGWGLLAKVALVAALLGFAARNKFRLVPALMQGDPAAAPALRRSIAWEGALVIAILLMTATITTVTSPAGTL